jgi:hypothetical protein
MNLEVYKITNKQNGKIYIGITNQGAQTRWLHHLYESRSGSDFPIHNAIRKYGVDNFQIEVIEVISGDYDYLKEREVYWVKFYDSYNKEKGYNLTVGGDGTFGRRHSEATKEKIRQKALGRKKSEEFKERLRNRISVNKVVIQYSLNGDVLGIYKSVAEASRQLNKNRHVISHCAKGHRPTAYGYIWKYKEDTGCDVKV